MRLLRAGPHFRAGLGVVLKFIYFAHKKKKKIITIKKKMEKKGNVRANPKQFETSAHALNKVIRMTAKKCILASNNEFLDTDCLFTDLRIF